MLRMPAAAKVGLVMGLLMAFGSWSTLAAEPEPAPAAEKENRPPGFDADLAQRLGADEMGMRRYVLVILKTGPTRMPDGEDRKSMFAGHFANMKRLAAEGKLVLAGPLDGVEGRRGIFVLAVPDIDAAREVVATDPVIIHGEMVADYHVWYGSAAIGLVNEIHPTIALKSF